MGLVISVKEGVPVSIGDSITIKADKATRLWIDAPREIPINRDAGDIDERASNEILIKKAKAYVAELQIPRPLKQRGIVFFVHGNPVGFRRTLNGSEHEGALPLLAGIIALPMDRPRPLMSLVVDGELDWRVL